MTDKLIESILCKKNPTVVGLDTAFDYLPDAMKKPCKTLSDAAKAITEFNLTLIDRLKNWIPAVKVQAAYYEMYGVEGMEAFSKTLNAAKSSGLVVIADVKRNDIGSTAGCYSSAYLGSVDINGNKFCAFNSDYITVNGYLGEDGIRPFLQDCSSNDRGIFVLVKTSNPSGGQLQNRTFEDGKTLYETMGSLVEEWGKPSIGKYGFSDVGAVVGATHPAEAEKIRVQMPHTFFLVPGYGAQGGGGDGAAVCFNHKGIGAIVNNSRGIQCAYKSEKYKGQTYAQAAENAVIDMREDLAAALARAGKIKL